MLPTIQEQKRAILEKGLKAVLEESSIPQRMHLQMVQALKNDLDAYRSALAESQDAHTQNAGEIAQHAQTIESTLNKVEETFARLEEEINRLTKIDHLKGEPGDSLDLDEVVTALIPHLPEPEVIDKRELVAEVLDLVQSSETKEVEELDTEALFKDFISRIQKERLIDVSHIKNSESFIFNKKKYKIEELMHGGGSNGSGTSSISMTYGLAAVQSGDNALVTLPTMGTNDSVLLLSRNGQILTFSTDYSVSSGVATVFSASASDAYAVAISSSTSSTSSLVTNTTLTAWTNSTSYSALSLTRDANEAITVGTIVWPDGSNGVFTTLVASTSFPGAIDSYKITYSPSSGPTKTITQPTVTRDAAGAVIAQPLLVIT